MRCRELDERYRCCVVFATGWRSALPTRLSCFRPLRVSCVRWSSGGANQESEYDTARPMMPMSFKLSGHSDWPDLLAA